MPLSQNEAEILHYLGKHKTATAGQVSRDLGLNRSAVRKALHGLAENKLATVDHGTFPASWSITDIGAAVLAAAATGQEPSRTVPRGASHVFRWTAGVWELQPLDAPEDAPPRLSAPSSADPAALTGFVWGQWGEQARLTRFEDAPGIPGYWVTRTDI